MTLSVVILAAGQGKRMKSDLPKVLQPLAGKPLLGHVLEAARGLEAAATCVVYGHGGEQVPATFPGIEVRWVLQAEQHGTGHAVAQAMPHVPDDHLVLVLYGDVPLVQTETLARLVAEAGEGAISILSVLLPDPTGYGRVVRDGAGNVVRIVEHKDANTKERAIHECNSGVMCAPAGRLRTWLAALKNDNAQGEYYLTDVIVAAVRSGLDVRAVIAPAATEVLGVNDKLQLAELEAAYRRRRADELMLAGATIVDPARFDARGPVSVGRDVYIDVNAVFEGTVKLGDRVRIGPNVVIRDSEIGDDTQVFPNCVIDRALIGRNCNIGPFARFRPASQLAAGVHIGNFVEVKNSVTGRGQQGEPPHLPRRRHRRREGQRGRGHDHLQLRRRQQARTVIGDGAFIGSGAELVAPVKIGAGATIGAGSTITRDAPEGQLTLERRSRSRSRAGNPRRSR